MVSLYIVLLAPEETIKHSFDCFGKGGLILSLYVTRLLHRFARQTRKLEPKTNPVESKQFLGAPVMFRCKTFSVAILVTAICLPSVSFAISPCYYQSIIFEVVKKGPDSNGEFSDEMIAVLRLSGYAAINDIRSQWQSADDRLASIEKTTSTRELNDQEQKEQAKLIRERDNLAKLIDQVAQQRGAMESGLFWHTEMDTAIEKAKTAGKPILSLRMLGNLTDELSCANSRFFRTTLYSNLDISNKLRKEFVLHWQSVRPVPKITIDFGDGRTLERTITGNSAHYLLDQTGQPLDCLPGLYGPGEFSKWLNQMGQLNTNTKELEGEAKRNFLVDFHRQQNTLLNLRLNETRVNSDDPVVSQLQKLVAEQEHPTNREAELVQAIPAIEAAPVAMSKSLIEAPVLKLAFDEKGIDQFVEEITEEQWKKLARFHAGTELLDKASIEIIKRENPSAKVAGELTRSKQLVEDPLVRLVRGFQNSILMDTVQNEYRLHRKIHQWFIDQPPTDVEALNKQVYAQLFLTPDSDPWLGLKPANVYSALENDGVKLTEK